MDSCKHACQFLTSLSKADNFDMTLMFMEDKEERRPAKVSKKKAAALSDEKKEGDDALRQ